MAIITKILTSMFLCFVLLVNSYAQKNSMHFTTLTTDNGLSENRVKCILRDSRDYVWIVTSDGLNRYDGVQIVFYKSDPENPKSICSNISRCIAEDAEKNVWVGTWSGLSRYNAKTDSFTSFNKIKGDSSSISSDSIYCLFLDNQKTFWIGGGTNKGLNKWNPESGTFTSYRIPGKEREDGSNAITGIVQDKTGNLWLASRSHEGLVKFDPNKVKFTIYNSTVKISNDKTYLFIDNDGIIWISTYGSGLYSFNPETQNYTSYNSNGDGKGTNTKVINNIIQEDDNNLLIAVDQGGINRYNKQTKLFEYIKSDPNNPNGLNNDGIWCMYKDKENILWVGTSAKGINVYNSKSQKFNLLKKIPNNPNSLSYNVINNLYEDSKGLLWISTDGGGISIYNRKTENFKNYKADPNTPYSLQSNVIRHTVEDRNHNYWFGTWDGGLIKLDHNTGKFIQYLPESLPPYNLSGRNVWYLMVDHNGIIWLSIFNEGIELLDPEKGIIKKIRLNPNIKAYNEHATIRDIYEDSHNNIWLCTDAGLKLYDTITDIPEFFPVFPESNPVSIIYEDTEGYYWAGSYNLGLVRFTLDGTILKRYTMTEGLSNNRVHAILEDDSNNIWISTDNGINRINYRTEKISIYSKSDGLQGNEFQFHSALKTESGEMYFGGTNGLNSFFPDSIKNNEYVPKVYINEFLIFNKPVSVGAPNSPFKNAIEQTKEIVLSYKQSVFSLGFLAINYTHPEKNLYAYKMEGFDTDWNYTDANRRLATYTNLPSGTYTFRVKASNNDGVWNEKGASLKIIITPPWWYTWWFITFVVLLILSTSLGFYRYRINQYKRQQEYLKSLVKQRTEEIDEKNSQLVQQAEELLKSNKNLEKSYSILTTTLESTADGILVFNKNGEITHYNQNLIKLLSIPQSIISACDYNSMIGFVLDQMKDKGVELMKGKNLFSEDEITSLDVLEFKSGQIFELYTKPQLLEGKSVGYVCSFRDITERKRAEESLIKSKSSLQELNATKDKFFSIIAHDLRSPFSVFLGLTELMADKSNNLSMEKMLLFSKEMNKSAISIYGLIENLLQWASMQQGSIPINFESLLLQKVVNECVELLKESANKKQIEIICDIPADLKIIADKNILQTIIRNLVSNALKFTPRSGQINIMVKTNTDKSIEIIVKDTGIGMNSKMVNNLFDLDADTYRKGTEGESSSGLGLILCKEFATKLNGEIWVESEEGKGTTIHLSLPDGNNYTN